MLDPTSKEIYQIVTRLAPAIDGVGDYALLLAKQLRQSSDIGTRFVVGDSTWAGLGHVEEFSVQRIKSRTSRALFAELSADNAQTLLVHYVGYGYAKRGCPIWLVDGVKRWKHNNNKRRLVTMFHELYAFGPPWTSAFWLSPLQRYLTSRLAQLSDIVITSQSSYALSLTNLSKGKHSEVQVMPVFSNVGEPTIVPPLQSRSRHMVVFGSRNKRTQVYEGFYQELVNATRVLEITKIVDIGILTGLNIQDINGIPVLELGPRPAVDVSNTLLNSVAGFMVNDPDRLSKSGIFAAYCAHGLLPINALGNRSGADGLWEGQHYLDGSQVQGNIGSSKLESIAANAFAWYRYHNLDVQGRVFATLLDSK